MSMRIAIGAAVALVVVGASLVACGGSSEPDENTLDVSIRLLGRDARFRLDCPANEPPSRALCAAVDAHDDLLLRPAHTQMTCLGGIGVPPEVSIRGTWDGEGVSYDRRACDLPGGAGALAWTLFDRYRRGERTDLVRAGTVVLRCDARVAEAERVRLADKLAHNRCVTTQHMRWRW